MIDASTKAGARALERLSSELVAWLTTVSPTGQPQSSPVWFLWRRRELLVYSLADAPRLRNIAANPRVGVNLNATPTGADVVVLEGRARVDPAAGPACADAEYVAKYGALIASYGWTPESFSRDYPVAIRIRPTRARTG